jgi:hypothetical protein
MAAGLGFKTFATGDILTAADANGYLMSQTVMVFADSTARAAAITSPQEGMITFLKDTDSTEYYSGSAYVAIGAPAAATFVGCFLSKSGTQTIATATATAITFDTENIDTNGFHSTATNTSRITIPSGKDGKYLVTPQVRSEANSTGRRIAAIYKNGSIILLNQFEQVPSATGSVTIGNSFIISLVATDYLELYFTQTSGGNLNAATEGTYFGVEYLGA